MIAPQLNCVFPRFQHMWLRPGWGALIYGRTIRVVFQYGELSSGGYVACGANRKKSLLQLNFSRLLQYICSFNTIAEKIT